MKKFSFIASLLGMLVCGLGTPVAAQDSNDSSWSCFDNSLYDGKFDVGAEWLYWNIQEDNLFPVTKGNTETDGTVKTRGVHRHCGKYDSGFRVWLGYDLPDHSWALGVSYLYIPHHTKIGPFKADHKTSFIQFSPDYLISVGTDTDTRSVSVSNFQSKWDLNLNKIDVDFTRAVCFGESFSIRPHIGFRALWSHQKLHFKLTSEDQGKDIDVDSRLSQKFTGLGVEGGLWADWKISGGLSLVGHFGGSILYSKYHLSESAHGSGETAVPAVLGSNKCYTGTPTIEYFAGLKYEDCLWDTNFSIHAGWESHVFFNFNRFNNIGAYGNFVAQGLTLGLDVAF